MELSPPQIRVLGCDLRQQGVAKMVHRHGDRVHKHRHLLDEALAQRAPDPLEERLERLPGQSQTRYCHLLGAHVEGDVGDVGDVGTEAAPAPGVERLERDAVGGGQR